MPRPRRALVSVAQTPYYHVFSRCVRRAFLCGEDRFSGRSYEHRRAWVEDRLRVLASLFSIEVCAYAVMSNHYHLVVKLLPDEARSWSDDEVMERWTALFKGPLLVQRHGMGEALTAAENGTLHSIAAIYRERLSNLSWFMKCLNEPIARKANAEDDCTGHFWESRFHSQALMTNRALITAMAYVDLNPIRAGLTHLAEDSQYTSIRARMRCTDTDKSVEAAAARLLDDQEIRRMDLVFKPLAPFAKEGQDIWQRCLPIEKRDYFELIAYSSRLTAKAKSFRIVPEPKSILAGLEISSEDWTAAVTEFRQHYLKGDVKVRKSA